MNERRHNKNSRDGSIKKKDKFNIAHLVSLKIHVQILQEKNVDRQHADW